MRDWEQVELLTDRSDRLSRWYRPGYLPVGYAAHAMRPINGVRINLAIQDAVVAANLLWRPLRRGRISTRDLARVQRRPELTVRVVQALQSFLQDQAARADLEAGQGLAVVAGRPTAAGRAPGYAT